MGLTFGVACSLCHDNLCVEPPTEDEPLCLPMRDGSTFEITECPNRFCGPQARKAVQLADFAKRGILPVTGGILDQTQHFLDATMLVWNEQAEYRREKKLIDTSD